jgi:TRAP-type C4-dicarboxylate transport system substrate-binding protein
MVGLSGCTGDGGGTGTAETTAADETGSGGADGGQGTTEFTWAGAHIEETECIDCVYPMPKWEAARRIEERSGGDISIDVQGDGAICGEGDCGQKITQSVIPVAENSVANTTKWFPENDVWGLPYFYPMEDSTTMAHAGMAKAFWSEAVWEDFWIPFAEKYGVVPFAWSHSAFRGIMISENIDERLYTPDDIDGLSIRRTFSYIPNTCLQEWGANPQNISWGDTVQGLESGVVDGSESSIEVAIAFGMTPVCSQVIVNNWSINPTPTWTRVEWLKQLPDTHRSTLAEVTKEVSVEMTQQVPDVVENRAGIHGSPPPEGSKLAEQGVSVNLLDEEQMQEWIEPIDPVEHPDLYQQTFDQLEELGAGGVDETIREEASSAPSPEEFSGSDISWWDEHIDDISVS